MTTFFQSFLIIRIHKSSKCDLTFNSLIWSVTMIVTWCLFNNKIYSVTLILSKLKIARQNIVRSSHRIAFIFSIVPIKKDWIFFQFKRKDWVKSTIEPNNIAICRETIQRRKVLKKMFQTIQRLWNEVICWAENSITQNWFQASYYKTNSHYLHLNLATDMKQNRLS